jgi:hypothetical protein
VLQVQWNGIEQTKHKNGDMADSMSNFLLNPMGFQTSFLFYFISIINI